MFFIPNDLSAFILSSTIYYAMLVPFIKIIPSSLIIPITIFVMINSSFIR
ncbi:MAG TPA: hypothetical protein PKI37_01275 [Candidatus Cloacimonas sp.]|nr:hypothetical protein [Candidatus Cloacimonas sp.]